jgi:hypothetical protein
MPIKRQAIGKTKLPLELRPIETTKTKNKKNKKKDKGLIDDFEEDLPSPPIKGSNKNMAGRIDKN